MIGSPPTSDLSQRKLFTDVTNAGLTIVNVQAPGLGKQSSAPRRMTFECVEHDVNVYV